MRSFESNADYLAFVEAFMARLRAEGHLQAADELLDGYRCINGLTDGWALYLEAVEGVQARTATRLSAADRADLEIIRAAAHKAVYRR
jgi:hypothetical protein